MVTGGAGYIGAHVVRALQAAGHEVVVLDDLSTGLRSKVAPTTLFVCASVLDTEAVQQAMSEHAVRGVIHLAAKKAVEESIHRPLWYYEENVEGFRRLLAAMENANVRRLVFSSSAAVYGDVATDMVTEGHPCEPTNPYGETKLACEWLTRAVAAAHAVQAVALRYFNVAGTVAPELVDPGTNNLIPMVLRDLAAGQAPRIFGDDYETPDGTCVRDFIHVQDLAEAHLAAAAATEHAGFRVFNVSRGVGFSVREVIDAAQRIVGSQLTPAVLARRPGDPARVVGSTEAISRSLGWTAGFGLDEMIESDADARGLSPLATRTV